MVVGFKLISLDARPNLCLLQSPVRLDVSFKVDKQLLRATWSIAFIVDMVLTRHVIKLGEVGPGVYDAASDNSFTFESAEFSFADVAPVYLNNVHLLSAVLTDEIEGCVAELSIIVQVQRQGKELFRTMIGQPPTS